MFYIGIDIAKHKHEASLIDSDGKLLCESISFSNTQKGCEKLLALMQKFTVTADNCIVGMEATGHYWLSVYSYLLELGYNLKLSIRFSQIVLERCISDKPRMMPKTLL